MTKVFMVFFMAAFLSRRREEVQLSWSGFLKPMVIMGGAVVLLHFEPDHGAMVILMATTFTLLFLAGAKLHRFMFLVMLCFAAFAWLAISKPYVINRLTSFLNPWAAEYVYGEGYQLTQALIAFGRGEWFGVGLGSSIQKLYFLPEAHTDFVLSILAEELGLAVAVLCADSDCIPGRSRCRDSTKLLQCICGLRSGHDFCHTGVYQFWGESRPVANERADAAISKLRWQQPVDQLFNDRGADAHRL